jgi:hypothetical protein
MPLTQTARSAEDLLRLAMIWGPGRQSRLWGFAP